MILDQDGGPRVDESARTLGARPWIDVPGDGSDPVEPNTGGMSVSSGSPQNLPVHRRPSTFAGTGADPVFSIEVPEIGHDLRWRADSEGLSGHGFLEPARRMPFHEYQEALWATRSRWRRVDP